jgi:prolyl oligopeptidase
LVAIVAAGDAAGGVVEFAWLAATQAGFAFAASAAGAGAACLTSDTSPQLGLHGSVVACFPPHGCLMPHISNAVLLAGLAIAGGAAAQTPPQDDPYAWLEDVSGAKSLDWVKARNAKAEADIASSAPFKTLEAQIRASLDSTAKIPGVEKIGAYYYNFWKDAQHQRGLWRRTTLDEYRKPEPAWETVLDLDALNTAEGTQWVWHGANCLRPKYQRCLIALSPGGSDADVTREFDLTTKQFVQDGFFRPEAKGGLGWIDENTVYVFTDFGAGTLTSSGYPRMVKQWTRGTPLASAKLVYAGKPDDMYISALHDDTPGFERDFISRTLAFYNDELYLRGANGQLTKVDAPNSAQKAVHKDWLLLELREPYTAGGKTYAAGALIATHFDAFMAGKRDFSVLFAPTDHAALASYAWTKDHLILNVMDHVKNRLSVFTPGKQVWGSTAFVGAPGIGTVGVSPVDPDDSNALWLTSTDFLSPTTLSIVDVGNAPEVLKSNPVFFDGSLDVIEQHFATSKDGTQVPYFLVRPKDLKFDGKTPTLLYGYGGFEISLTPSYSGAIGKGWLEKGGVYVLANIRGGGEYGPRWHQAALKANRHKAYEDFAAIADDLVARKITSPKHLGTMGGSNGGLLMGNMLTQYPEKFGAIVVQVPLLDMKRYNHLLAGASWMAEYGNPDTSDWDFIQTFSPYHLFDASKDYPPTLFTTSTKDDRVHPAHARKMMAKMEAAGKNVRYYENIEGGHGGAANNAQAAHMSALAYTFLWQQLTK